MDSYIFQKYLSEFKLSLLNFLSESLLHYPLHTLMNIDFVFFNIIYSIQGSRTTQSRGLLNRIVGRCIRREQGLPIMRICRIDSS